MMSSSRVLNLPLDRARARRTTFTAFHCADCPKRVGAPLGAVEAWHRCGGRAGAVRRLKGVAS